MSHKIDQERWSQLTIAEQMGNIYSEVGRSLNAKKRGDMKTSELAMVRALDLFDSTTEVCVSQKSPRTKEVLRARDQYLTELFGEQNNSSIEQYFLPYALLARKNR